MGKGSERGKEVLFFPERRGRIIVSEIYANVGLGQVVRLEGLEDSNHDSSDILRGVQEDPRKAIRGGKVMNQVQQKYAIERIEGIRVCKINDIKASCAFEEALSDDKKMELIYEGKVSLKKREANERRYSYLYEYYDFAALQPDNSAMEAEMNTRIEAVNAEARRLKDGVMLGNKDEVYAMLQDFSEKEF